MSKVKTYLVRYTNHGRGKNLNHTGVKRIDALSPEEAEKKVRNGENLSFMVLDSTYEVTVVEYDGTKKKSKRNK